jgi:hypothetical protein
MDGLEDPCREDLPLAYQTLLSDLAITIRHTNTFTQRASRGLTR